MNEASVSELAVSELKKLYPDAVCSLEYGGDTWRLLVMACLSAQCTDVRVNAVSVTLFDSFPDVYALAGADISKVEAIVRPCGLFHTKAKNIVAASGIIAGRFGGKVPEDMDALLTLPGVGRKVANLIRGDAFHLPAVVTDTHCIRVCGRLGFYSEALKNPHAVEKRLSAVIPPEEQSDFCHRTVLFGRDVCTARSPHCSECPLAFFCTHAVSGT